MAADPYFLTLVQSLATAALQQLGKIAHPFTGKVERSLPEAKVTIDILVALKEKTAGNLSPEEARAIGNAIATLQLNYVEEVKSVLRTTSEVTPDVLSVVGAATPAAGGPSSPPGPSQQQ